MFNSSFSVVLFWRELSLSYRLFVVVLLAVTIHSTTSAAIIIKGLRKLRTAAQAHKPDAFRLTSLSTRCGNLRQILGATFYLFGFLLFLGLQNAPITLSLNHAALFSEILPNLELHFVFAADVLLVFLVLHLLQWQVSYRVQVLAKHLSG
jgi:hypothetical protein